MTGMTVGTDFDQMTLAEVHDADQMTWDDAFALALKRDQEAAERLAKDFNTYTYVD